MYIKTVVVEKVSDFLLPLNIQYFAGEDGGTDDPKGDEDKVNDPDPNNDPDSSTDPDTNKDKTPPVGKTFTQDDVNAIAAKEAKKAQERLFRELGVKDAKSAKEGLTKFNEMKESQKTELQKAVDRAKDFEEQNGGLTTKTQNLEAQLSAFKAGVKADSLDDAVILAKNLVNDDTDMDAAIAAVLAKHPSFKAVTESADPDDDKSKDTKKPKFSKGEHKAGGKVTESEQWGNAFKFGQ